MHTMIELTCCRCGKPATIGEHDDAIGSFLACSDECHAAELAYRTENYQDEVAGVYDRKRERIAAIRAGEIEHPGYVGSDPGAPDGDVAVEVKIQDGKAIAMRVTPATASPLDVALARIEGRGAKRLE